MTLRLLMVPLSRGSSGMYGQLNMLIKNIFNSAEESKVIKENSIQNDLRKRRKACETARSF